MDSRHHRANTAKYGRALVKILQAFDVLEPKARWFERLLIKLLRGTYRQRLRAIVSVVPGEVGDEILGAMDAVAIAIS